MRGSVVGIERLALLAIVESLTAVVKAVGV